MPTQDEGWRKSGPVPQFSSQYMLSGSFINVVSSLDEFSGLNTRQRG